MMLSCSSPLASNNGELLAGYRGACAIVSTSRIHHAAGSGVLSSKIIPHRDKPCAANDERSGREKEVADEQ